MICSEDDAKELRPHEEIKKERGDKDVLGDIRKRVGRESPWEKEKKS
jgi:hypothetical protein